MKYTSILFVGLTLFTLGLLSSCGGKPNYDYEAVSRYFAADESLSPIIDEQLDIYNMRSKRDLLHGLYINEQDAIDSLLQMKTWLVFTTRALTQNELNILKSQQLRPRVYPLAYEGLALISNRENPDSLISVEAFRKILTGEITTWRELYPASTLDSIRVAFDNPRSSTVRFCVDSILNGQPMKTDGNVRAVQTSREVVDYVERHKNAIGIVGSIWLNDQRDTTNMVYGRGIRVMRVSNSVEPTPQNSYDPSQWNIAYAYYPFIRTIYALLTDPRSTGVARGFGNFCDQRDGQLIFFNAGLFPARADYSVRDVVIH
jgi:phosphate transport system substrate-binding protein